VLPQVKKDSVDLAGVAVPSVGFSKRLSALGQERTNLECRCTTRTAGCRPHSRMTSLSSLNSTLTALRPGPLHLSQEPSALLHTSWGSATSANFPSSKLSSFSHTPALHSQRPASSPIWLGVYKVLTRWCLALQKSPIPIRS